ncbi:threonine aspartase 1 isoform X1 [Daktulosphaira vitifoliae]|uniref:threonine aspartase 1 isoform X1 n=1 Tax=Daktulosphaira vitifoliae TaxID=58002 RepID=UPI0021A9EBD9|nr:threonine aspartase 1 isoform X1 [Daktulosphaira vitifoliae]
MKYVIAVHAGAGYLKPANEVKYKKLCKKACNKGLEVIANNGSALEAVTLATSVLEDSPITNAGYGSNLTWNGTVECDASIMDGKSMHFGGIGAVSGVKNPIKLAKLICEKQNMQLSFGRIPPCLLVGQGAYDFAKANNIAIVDPHELITDKSKKQFVYNKYKVMKDNIDIPMNKSRLDTVGCVCIDNLGRTAASSSSGGIILKHSGRVGQSALLGSGCWAQINENVSIAVTTSGCGEHLMKTNLAKEISHQLMNNECPTFAINKSFNEHFFQSPLLSSYKEKLAGALVLYQNNDYYEILSAHSTKTMCFAYATESNHKSIVSRLTPSTSGNRLLVHGYPV